MVKHKHTQTNYSHSQCIMITNVWLTKPVLTLFDDVRGTDFRLGQTSILANTFKCAPGNVKPCSLSVNESDTWMQTKLTSYVDDCAFAMMPVVVLDEN